MNQVSLTRRPNRARRVSRAVATVLAGAFVALETLSPALPALAAPVVAPSRQVQQPPSLLNGLTRRAVDMLESLRGSKMAPQWDNAWIGAPQPLYRPDVMEGPAYWEFPIEMQQGMAADSRAPNAPAASPAGFIVLSTGPHDYPIAHWNVEGKSPTQELTEKSLKQATPTVFYRLDALSYLAEDAQGNSVATVGTPLVKVGGMDPDWLDKPQVATEFVFTPTDSSDENKPSTGGISSTVGPISSSITLAGWESWQQLKTNYRSSYGVLLEALKREAEADWRTLSLLDQYGEGLRKGDVRRIAALASPVDWSLSGEGAQHVAVELVQRVGLPSLVQLTVNSSAAGAELPFTLTLMYANVTAGAHSPQSPNAVSEALRYTIIDPLPVRQTFLPIVGRDSASGESGAASRALPSLASLDHTPASPSDDWGPWTYYWAGTHGQQRLYDQIPASENPPNNSGCPSGCGGTAWAMLFGWADNQAALGNAYWAPRWGLYRVGGGFGADAVAPTYRDAGVTAMTWNIRNNIGTWCAFGNGPTFPWDMSGAWRYLSGRTGTRLETHYNSVGIHEGGLMVRARDSIVYRGTPAIIGTGWLNHYPLAYGYAWTSRTVRRCFLWWCWTDTEYAHAFYVNQGWGGSGNGWIPANTWFAGLIYP